ncbi:MAG: DUF3368 domain-containing protein [Caldilineaceae bacterium]
MNAVINSTPLITLAIVGQLDLLPQLFDAVIVPTSVFNEVTAQGLQRPGAYTVAQANWLIVQSPALISPWPPSMLGLDAGERDVILLAQECNADLVLIDEKLGRRVAISLGLPVRGTLGVLLIAYHTGLLTKADALAAATQLRHSAIRISERLLKWFENQL